MLPDFPASGRAYTRRMETATSSCPTCGTPRGHYDRFCTGCGEDLGAPGASIGMLLKGAPLPATSSGAARARPPAGPGVAMSPRPGVAAVPTTPRYGPARPAGGWVSPNGRTAGQAGPAASRYGEPGRRIWRTIAIANRLLAVFWLVLTGIGTLAAISVAGTGASGDAGISDPVLGFVIAGVLPAAIAWLAAPGIESGMPPILRLFAIVEVAGLVVFTLGLILVPLLVIYLFAGTRPATAGT